MTRLRIMIVDDEPVILDLLSAQLDSLDYSILTAVDGADAMKKFNEYQPDLVILDINMPGIDGIEVCRRLRQLSGIPIIMLSARTDYFDKVMCLEIGADDYITKPFNAAEFSARVSAVLRRSQRVLMKSDKPRRLVCNTLNGELLIDAAARRVTLAGKVMILTDIEFRLLWELVGNAGKAMTYSELLANVWGTEYKEETNYLHTYIRFLRAKIEPDPHNPQHLINIPRIGYRFDCTP